MASKEKANVGSRRKHQKRGIEESVDNNIAASGHLKCQTILALLSLVCLLSSIYFFGKVRVSDPTKLGLILLYSAFIIPPLVFGMSYARCCLATNHPTWCFIVEMFQAVFSSLTMTGSVQISVMKDEEKNILCCLGSMLLSLVLLEIAIEDTDDCGVSDMVLALFSTKLNATYPKYVPVICSTSYISKKVGIFTMKKMWNGRREAKEEDVEHEVNEKEVKNPMKGMHHFWVATKEKLMTETQTPESELKLIYPEFFRMGAILM